MKPNPVNNDIAQSRASIFSTQVTSGDYYHFGDIDSRENELDVVCGGLENCAADYKVDRSHFKYYGIEYIVSGTCKLTLEGKEYVLKSGNVFCYGPHIDHKIENTGDERLIKYFIDITGTDVPDLLWDVFLKDDSPLKLNNVKWISDIFQQILDCGKLGGPSARSLSKLLLKYLIERVRVEKIRTPESLSPAHCSYERASDYIKANYLQIKRMSEVASSCHVSLPHLCRLFKRFANESPTQLLIRLKLEKAVELISTGDYLVKEIADHVGFEDPFYFSHRFKQHFGVSPSNYVSAVKPETTRIAS